MAFDAQQKFASQSANGPGTMVFPDSIQTKTFASGTALLAPLTAVTFNTSTGHWSVLTNGGSNGTGTLKGFVGFEPIQLVNGSEVVGNVIMGGRIHIDAIPIVSGSYTLAQLKTAILAGARDLGLIIEGYADFN